MKPDISRRRAVCVRAAMLFEYTLDFHTDDFRHYPELYRVGWGEQVILLVQPYKAEILPHWRFKDAAAATESSVMIYGLSVAYLKVCDLVGADTARKFIQMGFTRARRYGNHRGGRSTPTPYPPTRKASAVLVAEPSCPAPLRCG